MHTQQRNGERPVVAHVASRYYSLTENWIHTQVKHLDRYRPLVLTWRTENLNGDFVPKYYALLERSRLEHLANGLARRLLGYYPSFYYRLHRRRAQLIHAHFGELGYFALPLARAVQRPLVTTFYGFDASKQPRQEPVWRQRYQALFQAGDCFLVEGPHLGRQLRDLGCPKEKIVVHHLGIEVNKFPFISRTLTNGQLLRILVVGRFTEKKGGIYAVEALARLVHQNIDARLTIIGDASWSEENQATKQQILKAIEQNGLSNRVELRGMQSHAELKRAYYEHHILLSPSVQASDGNNEGGAPVTLIEAAASGMPIVATYHCDIPEVVQDGVTGLLAPERDSEALANHLLTFVQHPHQIEAMGAAARQHIEAEYDATMQGRRLETIYQEVIRKTGGNDA